MKVQQRQFFFKAINVKRQMFDVIQNANLSTLCLILSVVIIIMFVLILMFSVI